ncbi:MAG: GNAT family N-acetyltransferase [Pseudomonadota bacterium]
MSAAALDGVLIVPFSADRAPDFRRINAEWIERYFSIEPKDSAILDNPQGYIIDAGGEVFFALDGDEVLGTCAVRPEGGGRAELSKMGVTPRAQGRGIGRLLIEAALQWFQASGEQVLFLESHRSLGPALKLYESAGFRHKDRPDVSAYDRCDVYMEWGPPGG